MSLWAIGKISGPTVSEELQNNPTTDTSVQADPYEKYNPTREARVEALIAEKYQNKEAIETFDFNEKTWWKYNISNINISTDSSTSTLSKYALDISKSLSPYALLSQDPVAVVQDIYNSGATSTISLIADTQTLHRTALESLLDVPVPTTATDLHLRIVNNIELQKTLLGNMMQIADQPLLALQASQIYQIVNLEFYKNISDLNKFFEVNNVSINPEDRITIPVIIGE